MMALDPWIAMHAEKAGVHSGFFFLRAGVQ
jgi:hypothetical protein